MPIRPQQCCYVKPVKLLCKEAECASPDKSAAFIVLSALRSVDEIFPAVFPLRPMELSCCKKKKECG